MSFSSTFGNSKPKQDVLTRLAAIKPNHGNYRKAQDAIAEITNVRADNVYLREQDRMKEEKILALELRVRQLENGHAARAA